METNFPDLACLNPLWAEGKANLATCVVFSVAQYCLPNLNPRELATNFELVSWRHFVSDQTLAAGSWWSFLVMVVSLDLRWCKDVADRLVTGQDFSRFQQLTRSEETPRKIGVITVHREYIWLANCVQQMALKYYTDKTYVAFNILTIGTWNVRTLMYIKDTDRPEWRTALVWREFAQLTSTLLLWMKPKSPKKETSKSDLFLWSVLINEIKCTRRNHIHRTTWQSSPALLHFVTVIFNKWRLWLNI